jgi:hypothetical protein
MKPAERPKSVVAIRNPLDLIVIERLFPLYDSLERHL